MECLRIRSSRHQQHTKDRDRGIYTSALAESVGLIVLLKILAMSNGQLPIQLQIAESESRIGPS